MHVASASSGISLVVLLYTAEVRELTTVPPETDGELNLTHLQICISPMHAGGGFACCQLAKRVYHSTLAVRDSRFPIPFVALTAFWCLVPTTVSVIPRTKLVSGAPTHIAMLHEG